LIIRPADRADTSEKLDKLIYAELPDPVTNPILFKQVSTHMMHGPCGPLNPNNVCMEGPAGGMHTCKDHFPKEYCDATEMAGDEYVVMRRRNTGVTVRRRGVELDNAWVVPYNPHLMKFDCHINVECIHGIAGMKYLFKYLLKGPVRITFCHGLMLTS
jgi:ATP-dependent DNA helicase PIF1